MPIRGVRWKWPSSGTPTMLSHGLGTAGGGRMCDLGVSTMVDPKVRQLETVSSVFKS